MHKKILGDAGVPWERFDFSRIGTEAPVLQS
jgi:hypothetical protein